MKRFRIAVHLAAVVATLSATPIEAADRPEFQCAPAGVVVAFPESDAFFSAEVKAWSPTTAARYTEGDRNCQAVTVTGYEGFPTKRCAYDNVDAGAGLYPPLHAQVILLDPSSRQLAAWSIHACRINGATDATMPGCLEALRAHVIGSNGAQFPVVGSVIESYCNSSRLYGNCSDLRKAKSPWIRPRHTWFRDGVSVDYKDIQGIHWDDTKYPDADFDSVLDVNRSDPNLGNTFAVARVAAATRDQWSAWRKHIGKGDLPSGLQGGIQGGAWRVVAASVHKAACSGVSNELFDAVVFSNAKWAVPQ